MESINQRQPYWGRDRKARCRASKGRDEDVFKSSELHVVVTDKSGVTLHVTLLSCVKFAEL